MSHAVYRWVGLVLFGVWYLVSRKVFVFVREQFYDSSFITKTRAIFNNIRRCRRGSGFAGVCRIVRAPRRRVMTWNTVLWWLDVGCSTWNEVGCRKVGRGLLTDNADFRGLGDPIVLSSCSQFVCIVKPAPGNHFARSSIMLHQPKLPTYRPETSAPSCLSPLISSSLVADPKTRVTINKFIPILQWSAQFALTNYCNSLLDFYAHNSGSDQHWMNSWMVSEKVNQSYVVLVCSGYFLLIYLFLAQV